MCGIVGGYWVDPPLNLEARLREALIEMRFRGPDDDGFELHSLARGTVALGHTRLSIIDLSSAGHQPMVSHDLRYAMVFNGEIYNYRELRRELSGIGCRFVSDSDTEVLLTAWSMWGRNCLRRLDGMFAFVVHDRATNVIHCVRDAFGIKPFFFSIRRGSFLFASTVAALLRIQAGKPSLDWQRSYDYLVHGDYDSNSRTFVDGVSQLPPGHCFSFDVESEVASEPFCWWRPQFREVRSLRFEEAAELVREQFLHNIRLHLRSDVRLGAALSGGIDSSAVVCAMRHVEPDAPIMTFSYIAPGTELSEESWVDRVNGFVKAEAHKTAASPEDLLSDLDEMILAQGEPFGSTSIYAQFLVFRLAREHGVAVTLDGQGADELLAGYSGYPGYRLISLLENDGPLAAHRFALNWSRWPQRSYRLAAMELGRILLPDAMYAFSRKALGRNFCPSWLDIPLLREHGVAFLESRPTRDSRSKGRRVVEQLSKSLQQRGLPALLRHADRNSMRYSVESRVPFLTTGMADLLLSLPENYLISHKGETKSVFRAAMRGIVPDEILDRRDKIGFATPEKDWLLGLSSPLREWIADDSPAVPFLLKTEVLKAFDRMVAGRVPFSWQLWRWVNFVRWTRLTCIT